jgi:hypothetical protein
MATEDRVIATLTASISALETENDALRAGGDPIELHYFNGPGRGELTRLCLAAGGKEFKDVRIEMADFGPIKADPTSIPSQCFGSMPVLKLADGTLIAQSMATQAYAAQYALGEGTTKTRSVDLMYAGTHADLQVLSNSVFPSWCAFFHACVCSRVPCTNACSARTKVKLLERKHFPRLPRSSSLQLSACFLPLAL